MARVTSSLGDDEFRSRANGIKLLILDIDGVMTDGSIVIDDHGKELKTFSVRDGFGIRCWLRAGGDVAIITGRVCQAVAHRCRDLGVERIIQGARDKIPAFRELLAEKGLEPASVCYLGDDLPDLPLIRACGIGATVADGHPVVREDADVVLESPGGKGAVRELIEAILACQGHWEEVIAHYRREIPVP
ncbi:3-deoxy-D-manno-octulosonate 8-phosphate phosphatase KdsC [Planctomycetes bacterium Pan216]|uniref:3-deoxy-D-manno-octulosonate 8-phosphate phosphatase KdsC n=1 Tax=Kolteria novifilia TaxID=2527975 RepID=A0A518B6Q5_9BACT|nr:3-deoxy-D-manno-octulosonate 8-phosphate phosphatase KdsC [Planctomycetes bacterium Pan216]